ncbi:MAG TPA: TerC family protein [Rhizomicrobium sp.]|jgi:YjbE family integral membrane protein|nr:TerC family protein [Rhizomicrobium sp.]
MSWHLTVFTQGGLVALAQVLMIDVVLAGDNAVVIGMAAARVPPAIRAKVIFAGLAAAVLFRLGMAVIAVRLLGIIGLTLAGGILLLWVAWRFWRDLSRHPPNQVQMDAKGSLGRAIFQIVLADISMSLDNVLAVAGAAREHLDVLAIGLLLSVALMGAAAGLIARLLDRFRWISYLGLAVVIYVALSMIWSGSHDVTQVLIGQG